MFFHQISKKFVEQTSSPLPKKKHKQERRDAPQTVQKKPSGDLADDPAIQTAIKHVDWNDEAALPEALPALLTDTKKATEDIKGLLHLGKAEAWSISRSGWRSWELWVVSCCFFVKKETFFLNVRSW